MSLLERYRMWYEYEKDCNHKMLVMLDSVPEVNRTDARFQQAVTIADHLAACREKWLDYMEGKGQTQGAWWNDQCELAALHPRFAAHESHWTDYLAYLEEDQLAKDFDFTEQGQRFSLPAEMQIIQLFGHASYHRGQIALLVDQLGGEAVDTDYVDWWWSRQ